MPERLREALENTGLPWEVEDGSKHYKVKLCGRLVAVYPLGKARDHNKRALLNTITQVRLAARQIKEIP